MIRSVNVDAGAALARLDAIADAAHNPKRALAEAADVFLTRISPRYIRQTALWRPLTPASRARKVRKGLPTRPLLGGSLERSLTVRGAPKQVRRINQQSAVVGTRHPLAHLHHKGTRRKLPARPLILLDQRDKDQLRSVFVRHLLQAQNARRRGRIGSAPRGLL